MKRHFIKKPKRFPGEGPKSYTPEALRGMGFKTHLESINYKMRLENDPLFALRRKQKGIDPSEGMIQDQVPAEQPILNQDSGPKVNTPPAKLDLRSVDPVQHQAKAELDYSRFQAQEGFEVKKHRQGPQTASDAQNLQIAQQQNQGALNNQNQDPFVNPTTPFPDPLKDQMNPFTKPGEKPPGI